MTATTAQSGQETPTKNKRVFTLKDIKRTVTVRVGLPGIYDTDEFELWSFVFRTKLSKEAQERRAKFLALPAAERTERSLEQALDEVCDLLVEVPEGFGDFPPESDGTLAERARKYFNQDPQLLEIADAANSAYYAKVLPREFPA